MSRYSFSTFWNLQILSGKRFSAQTEYISSKHSIFLAYMTLKSSVFQTRVVYCLLFTNKLIINISILTYNCLPITFLYVTGINLHFYNNTNKSDICLNICIYTLQLNIYFYHTQCFLFNKFNISSRNYKHKKSIWLCQWRFLVKCTCNEVALMFYLYS